MVSRSVDNHSYYKKRLEQLGYLNVVVTALEKDALNFLISEMKPDILLMGAWFYDGATPYKLGLLKKKFPDIYMAALAVGHYPDDLAMYFILNGAMAFATTFYGLDGWYEGLEIIRQRGHYISPAVIARITKRKIHPEAAGELTEIETVITKLICSRFKDHEIADNLEISRRTVNNHKTEIFRKLNVRTSVELIVAALANDIVTQNELCFFPRNYVLTPLPEKEKKAIRRKI